jgi:hypothetical protein
MRHRLPGGRRGVHGAVERDYFEGALEIAADAQGIQIRDELEPWIQNLCFWAIPSILAGEPTEILYFSKSGRLMLEPVDGDVRLGGDRNPDVVVERSSLARELVGCGERFLAFARSVKADDANYMAIVHDYDGYAKNARQALETASA